MSKKNVPSFINEKEAESFIKNRDILMKYVERDYVFLTWICWGLDLLFRDYSFEEMRRYLGTVSIEELKQFIVPIETTIKAEDIEGIILDKHFELCENNEVVGYLIIENQLEISSYEEIDARGLAYIVASLFYAYDQVIDKKHYRLVNPPTALWIFPEPPIKLKNHITDQPIVFPIEDKIYNLQKGSSLSPVSQSPQFQIVTNVFKYYIGSCLNIEAQSLNDKSKAGKRAYLCLLLDCLFNFEVAKEVRLKIVLEYFNFNGDEIMNETEKVMNELNRWILKYYEKGETKGFEKGKTEGFDEGKTEGIEESILKATNNLIKRSKENGHEISYEEALTEAKALLS